MADFPVVGDESIYLRWAEIVDNQGTWLISMYDGKPPLSTWLYALERMVWNGDLLYAGRLLSVFAGVGSTWFIYRIGNRLGDRQTGLIAAGLYAILPWAMLYDRLMYTEGLLNFAGVLAAYASLRAFDRALTVGAAAVAGLAFGVGFLVKSTILLLAPVPLLVVVLFQRDRWRNVLPRLGVTYGVAALFPLAAWMAMPETPVSETYSIVLHKWHFFVGLDQMIADLGSTLGPNVENLMGYLGAYLTWVGLAAAMISLGLLAKTRYGLAALLVSISVLPVVAQVVLIDRHFSRYAFPHVWPLLIAIALAYGVLRDRGQRTAGYALVGITAIAFCIHTAGILARPSRALASDDASYYFTDRPNAGFGINQVIGQIFNTARAEGRTLVLTDPTWGTPADAIIAIANRRGNVEAHEAWWIRQDPGGPILPGRGAELWTSHYDRQPAATIEFSNYAAIYYVTITNYHSRDEVKRRAPYSSLEFSVPKPGGQESLDLYRLR